MYSKNIYATKDSEKDSTLSDDERDISQSLTNSNKIMIVVKTLTDTAFPLPTDTSDAVSKIKALIEERKGIAADKYRLAFKGKQIEDEKLLSDYGIQHESFIQMVPNDAKKIQMAVMNNDGETFTLTMNATDTIENAKAEIQDKYHIPLDRQCFTCFDERTMHNGNDEMEEIYESIKEVHEDIAAINGALENINFVSNNVNDQDFDLSLFDPEERSDDDNRLPSVDSSPEDSSDDEPVSEASEDEETETSNNGRGSTLNSSSNESSDEDGEDENSTEDDENGDPDSDATDLQSTENSNQSNVIKNFKFVTKTCGKKDVEYLCVFSNDERTRCYYYTWKTGNNKYVCNKCNHTKGPYLWAILNKNENGEEYVELAKTQHRCEPQIFTERILVKLPNYEILDKKSNGKTVHLKVFIGNDKYYKYTYHKLRKMFVCYSCLTKKINSVYVNAWLKNKNGEECIEMGDNQHVCEPKSIKKNYEI